MSTDRELLEKAAKAAGIVSTYDDGGPYFVRPGCEFQQWDPLTDDGDALRLAVRLRLNLNFEEWDGAEYACALPHKSHQGHDEALGDDECADTRRAIVRAAAAIHDAGAR